MQDQTQGRGYLPYLETTALMEAMWGNRQEAKRMLSEMTDEQLINFQHHVGILHVLIMELRVDRRLESAVAKQAMRGG